MKKRLKLSRHSLAVIEQSKIDLIDRDKIWEKWELCIDRFQIL
jgi:DNA-binding XRE family transcriptional regulator